MIWAVAAAALGGSVIAAVRWLRVAQREHYLPGVTRLGIAWWTRDRTNILLSVTALAGVLASAVVPAAGLVPAAVAAVGPVGLGLRGRTSPLAWTARLRRLAVAVGIVLVALTSGAALLGWLPLVAAVPPAVPVVTDLVLLAMGPIERRIGSRWVESAASILERVRPTVVAITGSYGKTSTKSFVAHLIGEIREVVPSPASFNNRMGLARAVNEHLSGATDVFVAEMGTYGPGEIRALCEWVRPDVAVITALGPVHLERMGSLDAIAAAKREILERAPVGVVSIDHPLLAEIAEEESASKRIITCSGRGLSADVSVGSNGSVSVGGVEVGTFHPCQAHPGNVAAAVGVVVALGIDPARVSHRLETLPVIPHRRSVGRSDRGFSIIDDTFNANPDGARAAVELLGGLGSEGGRKVVVTPGLVELGPAQDAANRRFMADAAAHGVTDVVVVAQTNRRALVQGAAESSIGSVIVVDTRDDAVRWVRDTLAEGDAVLYENDLPDHFP